jgi:CO/xanthine dehydrogenase Mo-binding subunit
MQNSTNQDRTTYTMPSILDAQQVVLPVRAAYVGDFTIDTTLDASQYLLIEHLPFAAFEVGIGIERLPLLARTKASYIGEPLALILAPSIWQAHLNRQELQVNYKGRPKFNLDTADSKSLDKKDVTTVHEVLVARKLKRGFDVEAMFAVADKTFSQKYNIESTILELDENFGAYACYDADKVVVYVASTWIQTIA